MGKAERPNDRYYAIGEEERTPGNRSWRSDCRGFGHYSSHHLVWKKGSARNCRGADGGAGTYVLGIFLHFFIAFSVATIYYAASRRLRFLIEHPLVCGLFYGAAVDQIMTLIVLPLSALHARGPFKLHDLILGLAVHSVVIGLPISFSVRRFAK